MKLQRKKEQNEVSVCDGESETNRTRRFETRLLLCFPRALWFSFEAQFTEEEKLTACSGGRKLAELPSTDPSREAKRSRRR